MLVRLVKAWNDFWDSFEPPETWRDRFPLVDAPSVAHARDHRKHPTGNTEFHPITGLMIPKKSELG